MNALKISLFSMALLLLFSCSEDKADSGSWATPPAPLEKPPLSVMAVRAELSAVTIRIEGAGRIEGIRESDIISETSGEIETMNFEMGDYVRKGELLLTVENELPRLAYESARMELRAAELEVEALEKSYEAGGTSLIDYQKKLALMAAMKLKAQQASVAYENTRIRAPYSGYAGIREKGIEVGSVLGVGDTVTHLVDRSSFHIRIRVGEDEIPLIARGDEVQVSVEALGGLIVDARVTAVSPGSLTGGGGFPVWISWENNADNQVKSGMSARVSIITSDQGEESLFLPEQAIQTRGGESFVYRAKDGQAEVVGIEYGRTLDGRVFQSEGGLVPGDMIITSGFGTLLPGDSVNVSEQPGGLDP